MRRIDHLGETEDEEDERPVVPQTAGIHEVEVVEREEHAHQDHGEAEYQSRGESKSRLFFRHMHSSGLTGGARRSSRNAGRVPPELRIGSCKVLWGSAEGAIGAEALGARIPER